jgi:chaperonin cofactor prefoldin
LNLKIDTEITLVETKINQLKELMDKELFEHKESVEAKCNKFGKQLSDFSEVVEELVAINEDNTIKSDSKFRLAEIRLESFKEMVVQIVKTKCEEVSSRLGEQVDRLENKSEDLNSQIEKVKEMQKQIKSDTPRAENFHADGDKTRNNRELDEIRKEKEIRTFSVSQIHQEENSTTGLSNIDVNLPQFGEGKDSNPMLHLKQLEQYFDLKRVPQSHRLVIACKSVVGGLSRQWLEVIADKFRNYEEFRQAFVNTRWPPSQQSLEKCKLYQDEYDPSTGITFSAHFIKYAKTAAYLEPN